jgi:hypothetical protein
MFFNLIFYCPDREPRSAAHLLILPNQPNPNYSDNRKHRAAARNPSYDYYCPL